MTASVEILMLFLILRPSASLVASDAQDHRKIMGLIYRRNNFYEERNTEMGLTVMCSSAHKFS